MNDCNKNQHITTSVIISWLSSIKLQNYLLKITLSGFTFALWLNLLSSHLTTTLAPPKGIIGLSCKSMEQTCRNRLQILDTRLLFMDNARAILSCGSSCVKKKMALRRVPKAIFGNISKRLFVRKFLRFLHPLHRLLTDNRKEKSLNNKNYYSVSLPYNYHFFDLQLLHPATAETGK